MNQYFELISIFCGILNFKEYFLNFVLKKRRIFKQNLLQQISK